MLVQQHNYLNSLAVALLLVCSGTQARAELEPAGLAVYTETARDVYVAALLLPPGSRLEDITLAPGPRAMEFRIALRRISSRGFSGMLLLQGELGSGSRAPEQVIAAISKLKNTIKSALKQGDRFIIALSKNDTTSFVLNGVELLSIDDSLVFNFFFTGWVGESSSVFFRDTLLSGHLDAGTLAWYESLAPSDERLAITSSWGAAPAALSPAPALAVASASQVAASLQLAASSTVNARPETTRLSAARRVAAPVTPVEPAKAAAPAPAPVAKKKPTAGKKSASKPTQVASLAKTVADTDAPQFDDREYQRQLNEYVTHIMKKVFSKVVYPRRAIKREHQGKVELLVHLDENGELLEVSLDNSSGHNMLDAAARKAVRKAAPFPELTLVAREEFLSEDGTGYIMPIPITFKLSN